MSRLAQRFAVVPVVLLLGCGQGTGPMLLPAYDGPKRAGQENPTGYQPGSVNIFDLVPGAGSWQDPSAYQVVIAPGIDWNSANLAAQTMLRNGVPGHLATITSAEEDLVITGLRKAVTQKELWIGGFQPAGSVEPAGGWIWVNGEGSIAPTNAGPGYANWSGGEPNNSGGNESELATGHGNSAWNDQGNLGYVEGYIVEWDY